MLRSCSSSASLPSSSSSSAAAAAVFPSRHYCPLQFFVSHQQRALPPSQNHGHVIAFDHCISTRSFTIRSRRAPRPIYANSPGPTSENDEWLQRLPEKKKPLYSHSLPCIEAWLKTLGFVQTKEDRATWTIERSDWHARLSLDVTDLFIRYLKSGPGNLDRDIERKFSYALSREDLENAILGGP